MCDSGHPTGPTLRDRHGVVRLVASGVPGRNTIGRALRRCQPPPPRATRLSTCRVSFPWTELNSTSVASPPTAS
jgi:hypothetical protein